MPTYQYRCNNCGNELEIVQKMSDDSLTTCPKCANESFERVITGEGGFVLKGSGFIKQTITQTQKILLQRLLLPAQPLHARPVPWQNRFPGKASPSGEAFLLLKRIFIFSPCKF